MSDNSAELRQKLSVASDLHGVVRTMKAMAASGITKFEKAVLALAEYDRVVQFGLGAVLREMQWHADVATFTTAKSGVVNAIVFGSDQGLIGDFNDVIAEFAIDTLSGLPGPVAVWTVGQRVHDRLLGTDFDIRGLFLVPTDVGGIASLVANLQASAESAGIHGGGEPLFVFYNSYSATNGYGPTSHQLLPLNRTWRDKMLACRWPTTRAPEVLGNSRSGLPALVREYLFISLFRACAESLASENACRLAAMQRAEKNIDELTDALTQRLHRARQTSIDEQLFDVVSGFEALN